MVRMPCPYGPAGPSRGRLPSSPSGSTRRGRTCPLTLHSLGNGMNFLRKKHNVAPLPNM